MSVQLLYISTTSRRPRANPRRHRARRRTASHQIMNEIAPLLHGCAEAAGVGRRASARPPPPAAGPRPGPTGAWRGAPGASTAVPDERRTAGRGTARARRTRTGRAPACSATPALGHGRADGARDRSCSPHNSCRRRSATDKHNAAWPASAFAQDIRPHRARSWSGPRILTPAVPDAGDATSSV
jgi:hypothetical protein